MPHINFKNDEPGIRGPMTYSPETARPMNELAEILLRSDNNSLSKGDRELIGTYVSYLNNCFFCQNVHGAMAGHYLGCDMEEIDSIKENFTTANISPKMKTLLAIAASVQRGGKYVTEEQIVAARNSRATEKEIHDTVLIAAAFCMFNRYVDGLATVAPQDREFYVKRAPVRAAEGYTRSIKKQPVAAD